MADIVESKPQNYHQVYYEKRADELREYYRNYRDSHREIFREYSKTYYHDNKKQSHCDICNKDVLIMKSHLKSKKHIENEEISKGIRPAGEKKKITFKLESPTSPVKKTVKKLNISESPVKKTVKKLDIVDKLSPKKVLNLDF